MLRLWVFLIPGLFLVKESKQFQFSSRSFTKLSGYIVTVSGGTMEYTSISSSTKCSALCLSVSSCDGFRFQNSVCQTYQDVKEIEEAPSSHIHIDPFVQSKVVTSSTVSSTTELTSTESTVSTTEEMTTTKSTTVTSTTELTPQTSTTSSTNTELTTVPSTTSNTSPTTTEVATKITTTVPSTTSTTSLTTTEVATKITTTVPTTTRPTTPARITPAPTIITSDGRYANFFINKLTRNDANAKCKEDLGPSARLFIIKTNAEALELRRIMDEQSNDKYWIGLYKDANEVMKWVDGTGASQFDAVSEVDQNNDDDIYAYAEDDGSSHIKIKFKDEDHEEDGYICEIPK